MKKEYDFSNAKRATEVPHLNKLRAESQKKRITIYLDEDIVSGFKLKALEVGTGYQTEINRVLKQYLRSGGASLEEVVRMAVREELAQIKS